MTPVVPAAHPTCGPAALGTAVSLQDLPLPELALMVAFGVLLLLCVLLLLRRHPIAHVETDFAGGARSASGRYLQHLHRVLRAIRAINNTIVTVQDRTHLLQKACYTLTSTRGYTMAWIGLVEEGTMRVVPAAEAGLERGYLQAIEVTWDDSPTGQGPTGHAIRSGEPAIMRDIKNAPEFRPWREQALERGYRSSAAVPLRCRGRVLGALNVYSDIPDAFDLEEVGLLQEVADHIAYALTALRLEQELEDARRESRRCSRVVSLFEHAPLGMMTTDGDGLVTSVNPAMLRLLGEPHGPEALVGRRRVRRMGALGGVEAKAPIERLLGEGRPVEFTCPAPEGAAGARVRFRAVPIFGADEKLTETIWLAREAPVGEEAEAGSG